MEVGLNTGELDQYITIQSVPEVQNDDGEDVSGTAVDEWPDVAAKFLDRKGREFEQARQMSAETVGIVETRYIPGITSRHQFVFRDRTYYLTFVDNVGEQDVKLHLHFKEPV